MSEWFVVIGWLVVVALHSFACRLFYSDFENRTF